MLVEALLSGKRSLAEAKELHGLRYDRMLGIHNMYEQAFLIAAVQNMKRIARTFRLLLGIAFSRKQLLCRRPGVPRMEPRASGKGRSLYALPTPANYAAA